MVLYPAVSLVSVNPAGSLNHTPRDARALAQGRLSLLLALEVAPIGRATADRHEAMRVDPADEHGEFALGRATHSRRTCAYRKSHPAIVMMQAAQDRAADDIPGPFNAARYRRVLVQ